MKVAIVFNHPYEGSYCTAILKSVITGLNRAGHTIDVLHLDKDEFDPVMRARDLKGYKDGAPCDQQVIAYRERLAVAEHLIFIFPVWWELMPAMTKGFIDKVIFPGVAFDHDHTGRFPKMVKKFHLLNGITIITTMNTPSIIYRLVFGNAIKKALFTGTFWKLGYKKRKWISFNMVKFVKEEKRGKWLRQLETYYGELK
jgi:NAD(P)H dehydrogenase (quinone)